MRRRFILFSLIILIEGENKELRIRAADAVALEDAALAREAAALASAREAAVLAQAAVQRLYARDGLAPWIPKPGGSSF